MDNTVPRPAEVQADQAHLDVLDPPVPHGGAQQQHSSNNLTRWGSATAYQSNLTSTHSTEAQQAPPHGTNDGSIESGKVDSVAHEFVLQPQDEGFGAWSYVAATFAMYIVVWGLPQSLPVFQALLSAGSKPKFPNSVVIYLLTPGIQDFQEGFLFHILPRNAKYRKTIIMTGITIMVTAFLLASYAEHAWQVVLLHGHVFGIGGVMLNFVHVSVFSEWFDKRRTEAMSIIWLGYRLGAVASPLLCNWLLEKHGYAQTLRVLLAPMLTLLGPSIFLLRGRYSPSSVVTETVEPQLSLISVLRQPLVLFFLAASFLFNLVTFMPVMFITTFGVDLGLSFSDAVVALAVYNVFRMVGTYLAGALVKTSSPNNFAMGLLAFSTAVNHVLVWGFCKDRLQLFFYAVIIGLSTGGFDNALYPLFSEVAGSDRRMYTAIHSIFSFARSLGTMSVGPLGALILMHSPAVDKTSFAMAKYKYLVFYAFACSSGSAILFFGRAATQADLPAMPAIWWVLKKSTATNADPPKTPSTSHT